MHIYVCVYVCVCVYIYIYIYIYSYAYSDNKYKSTFLAKATEQHQILKVWGRVYSHLFIVITPS